LADDFVVAAAAEVAAAAVVAEVVVVDAAADSQHEKSLAQCEELVRYVEPVQCALPAQCAHQEDEYRQRLHEDVHCSAENVAVADTVNVEGVDTCAVADQAAVYAAEWVVAKCSVADDLEAHHGARYVAGE
jgi:hypothetical protein